MTIEEVLCGVGSGSAEIATHPELLEILVTLGSNGVFKLSEIDKTHARINVGTPDDAEAEIIIIHYADSRNRWYKDQKPRNYLTWKQFVRHGRPTEIKVNTQYHITNP